MRYIIVHLVSNPGDTVPLNTGPERRAIEAAIAQAKNRDLFEYYPVPDAMPDDLQPVLLTRKPHILHFSGHTSPGGHLILTGKNGNSTRLAPDDFEELLRLLGGNILCVVLNSCFTDELAEAIAGRVRGCVIGAKGDLKDDAACIFSESFYRAVFDGNNL